MGDFFASLATLQCSRSADHAVQAVSQLACGIESGEFQPAHLGASVLSLAEVTHLFPQSLPLALATSQCLQLIVEKLTQLPPDAAFVAADHALLCTKRFAFDSQLAIACLSLLATLILQLATDPDTIDTEELHPMDCIGIEPHDRLLAGAASAAMRIPTDFPQNVTMEECVISALGVISRSPRGSSHVVEHGGLDWAIAFLSRTELSADSAECGLIVLHHVAMASERYRRSIARSDLALAAISRQLASPLNVACEWRAFAVVASLLRSPEVGKHVVASARETCDSTSLLPHLLRAINSRELGFTKIAYASLATARLAALAGSTVYVSSLGTLGGVLKLVAHMSALPVPVTRTATRHDVRVDESYASALHWLAQALGVFASAPVLCPIIASQGTTSLVSAALRMFSVTRVVSPCLSTIASLLESCPHEARHIFIECDGMRLTVRCLVSHRNELDVILNATRIMALLTRQPRCHELAMTLSCADPLIQCLHLYRHDSRIVTNCAEALGHLARKPGVRNKVVSNGGLEILQQSLHEFADVPELQRVVSDVVCVVSETECCVQ
eukprot:TRINITY_DN17607_c0_g1_i1.p1 TRINITY_DN17607_c0_g1~~TRINITY_DN17607_c0_g1_i1.p1  ORF type:complete len:569 (+),score=45.75 TRINITY_DN17607_c0_g1_i1:32-1708(+)